MFENVGACLLVMPGGKEVPPGGKVKIDPKLAENSAVAEWIKSGLLAKVK